MTRVVMHIDKLVLRGIDRADARAISVGIETQLKQLLGGSMLPTSLAEVGDRRRIKAGVVKFKKAGSAERLGRKAAKQIVKGLES